MNDQTYLSIIIFSFKFSQYSISFDILQNLTLGNPCNTNALTCMKNAPSIPKENFSCLTRLDQNRAKSQVCVISNV